MTNILYLICAAPVPIIMIIIGVWLWKRPHAPGNIGYKSKRSYSSVQAWYFAQMAWGKLSVFSNIPSFIGTVIACVVGIILNLSERNGLILYLAVTAVQCVVIFADIFITEYKLKKHFNPDGTNKHSRMW